MSKRFIDKFTQAWERVEDKRWIYGQMGKISPTGSYTFTVPGRPTFVWVTIRNAQGAQSAVPARNDPGVPQAPRLNVRMKLEKGVYVIYGKVGRQDLGSNPASPPSGVDEHNHDNLYYEKSEYISSSGGVLDAAKPILTDSNGLISTTFLVEPTQDIVGAMATDSASIDFTYDDSAGTLTATVITEAIQDIIGSTWVDSSSIDVTYNDAGNTISAAIIDEYVQDVVGAMFVDSASIDFTYTDASNTITATVITEAIQDIIGAFFTDSSSIDFTYNDAGNSITVAIIDEYVQDVVGAMFVDSSSIDFTYTDASNTITATVITEAIQDIMGSTWVDSSSIDFTYDDTANTMTGTVITEAIQDIVGALFVDSATLDFTYDDTANTMTGIVINNSITFAKMQQINTSKLLGRLTAAVGNVEEITLGAFGATLINEGTAAAARGDLGLGNLAVLDNVDTGHIVSDAVDNSKLANMAVNTVKGRVTAGTGDPEDLSASQLNTILETAPIYALLAGRSGGQSLFLGPLTNALTRTSPVGTNTKLYAETLNTDAIAQFWQDTADALGPIVVLGKSRGTAVYSNTIVALDDVLGQINFHGGDGGSTTAATGAIIKAVVDGTPGNNDMPTRLEFMTSPDGSNTPVTRMLIDNAGLVGIGPDDPTQNLHVSSAAAVGIALSISGSYKGYIGGALNAGQWSAISEASDLVVRAETNNLVLTARNATGNILFATGATDTQKAVLTNAGFFGVGRTPLQNFEVQGVINAVNSGAAAVLQVTTYRANITQGILQFASSRGTEAAPAIPILDDRLGQVLAYGYSAAAANYVPAAVIRFELDGTADSGGDTTDMPGRISFWTTPEGTGSVVERLRIDNSGAVGFGTTDVEAAPTNFMNFQLGSRAYVLFSLTGSGFYLLDNSYYDGTNWKYRTTNVASLYQIVSGTHIWDVVGSGTIDTTNITWTEVMRITNAGDIGIKDSTPSYQLDVNGDGRFVSLLTLDSGVSFGETTLANYKESTWTPAVTFGGGNAGITYTSQVGTYTRIGNVVIATCSILMANKGTSTGAAEITGLPFAAKANCSSPAALEWANMATSFVSGIAKVQVSSTVIALEGITAASANAATVMTNTNFNNNSQLKFTIVYLV